MTNEKKAVNKKIKNGAELAGIKSPLKGNVKA